MSLLFSPGSHLSDVPPDFRGVPMRAWRMAQITEQANSPAAREFWKKFAVDGKAPIDKKKIVTPRDEYGMKGVRR